MKYLKFYENVENDIPDYKYRYLRFKYGIEKYTINPDDTLGVFQNVDLSYQGLTKIPYTFGVVDGSFNCSNNRLTSLKGCPKRVDGPFDCSVNQLKSLVGSPEYIDGDFLCYNNKIMSFEGFPKHISGNVICSVNPINDIWVLFNSRDNIELFNDYDIIQDNNLIIDRLIDFLEEIGHNKPGHLINKNSEYYNRLQKNYKII